VRKPWQELRISKAEWELYKRGRRLLESGKANVQAAKILMDTQADKVSSAQKLLASGMEKMDRAGSILETLKQQLNKRKQIARAKRPDMQGQRPVFTGKQLAKLVKKGK